MRLKTQSGSWEKHEWHWWIRPFQRKSGWNFLDDEKGTTNNAKKWKRTLNTEMKNKCKQAKEEWLNETYT